MWVFSSTLQSNSLSTSWMSYSLTQFWYYLPGDESDPMGMPRLSPTGLLLPAEVNGKSRLLSVPQSPGYRLEVPQSSPWIHLLRIAHRTQSNILLTRLTWVYYEGYNSGTARWRRDEDQEVGRGGELHTLLVALSPGKGAPKSPWAHQPRGSQNHALLGF